jgi:hypothetical protein
MGRTMRRLIVAATSVAVLMSRPAMAAADCTGPDCGPPEVVEASGIVWTLAIVLVFLAVMLAAEFRRR